MVDSRVSAKCMQCRVQGFSCTYSRVSGDYCLRNALAKGIKGVQDSKSVLATGFQGVPWVSAIEFKEVESSNDEHATGF
jgi:hypothetical protein